MRGDESNEARTMSMLCISDWFPFIQRLDQKGLKLRSVHSVLRHRWWFLTLNTGILKPPNQRQPAIRPFDPSPLCNSPFGHYRKCEQTINPRLSLTFFLPVWALSLALGSNVYAFTEIAGGIVREKKRRVYFFSFSLSLFFSYAISCLQKPLMPIQHQHQGTALMSILAADLFLSLLPAALSVSSSSPYPPLSLPLPFAHSLRLLYNQIIKRIVDKMILPGN